MHSPKRKSFLSSPGPSYMTKEQMGDYLNNLRNYRSPRPNIVSNSSHITIPYSVQTNGLNSETSRSSSSSSSYSDRQSSETAIPPLPLTNQPKEDYTRSANRRPEGYSQVRDLRVAMDGLKMDNEQAVYMAAQQQAAELIHSHQEQRKNGKTEWARDIPTYMNTTALSIERSRPAQPTAINNDLPINTSEPISADLPNIKKRSSYSKLANYWNNSGLAQRRKSSGSKRSVSGKNKGIFVNPTDKIYEDPVDRSPVNATVDHVVQDAKPPTKSALPRSNPFARVHSTRDHRHHGGRVESQPHGNHSQSSKTQNSWPAVRNYDKSISEIRDGQIQDETKFNNGIEVRSEELRAATSKTLQNRSEKLPSPIFVSDSPERPIVSFKANWSPGKDQRKRPLRHQASFPLPGIHSQSPEPSARTRSPSSDLNRATETTPAMNQAAVVHATQSDRSTLDAGKIPMINVEILEDRQSPGTVHIGGVPIPEIRVEVASPARPEDNSRQNEKQRPKHRYSAFPPPQSHPVLPSSGAQPARPHISPTGRRATALCAQCALPISGRIVSAAGLRFHPSCFTCCHCNEGLECVDFYPEPTENREARLDRIQRRLDGDYVEDAPGVTEADDGDDSLRFYCHLDFHELFSPRCKSCKTPIEGEIVVACGAEWHVGHFFCAQCGDPFDQTTPYVEREGYAWCVECHTNRYSAKCKRCKKPVTNMVVQALDAEWHNECFCCSSCGSSFNDGKFFLRAGTQEPVCLSCEQRRLKA